MITLLLTAAASAYIPPRPLDLRWETQMPLADLQICATTALIRIGRVTPISAPGKAVLAVQVAPPLFGPPGHEVLNIEITDTGDKRVVTASYRHPYSAKSATKLAEEVRKRCPL